MPFIEPTEKTTKIRNNIMDQISQDKKIPARTRENLKKRIDELVLEYDKLRRKIKILEETKLRPDLPPDPAKLAQKIHEKYSIPITVSMNDLKYRFSLPDEERLFLIRFHKNRRDFELFYYLQMKYK